MNKKLKIILNIIINSYANINPFIIGITGAMGVGKSTFTNHLTTYLQKYLPEDVIISSINTDSFLYDNNTLNKHNLMKKKGFPESFNQKLFYDFLINLKKNENNSYKLPVYSQLIKDIDQNQISIIKKSNIYILEGINLFFPYNNIVPIDLLNMSILLKMNQKDIKKQCIKRFNNALYNHKNNPSDYFDLLKLKNKKAIATYRNSLWNDINKPFYDLYIKPNIKNVTNVLNIQHQTNGNSSTYLFNNII